MANNLKEWVAAGDNGFGGDKTRKVDLGNGLVASVTAQPSEKLYVTVFAGDGLGQAVRQSAQGLLSEKPHTSDPGVSATEMASKLAKLASLPPRRDPAPFVATPYRELQMQGLVPDPVRPATRSSESNPAQTNG